MKMGLLLFLISAASLFFYGQVSHALDSSGYLENKIQIANNENITETNKFKLDTQVKSDTYFMLVSIVGINNLIDDDDESVELKEKNNILKLNRAYLDLYKTWGKVTIGLQNLAWGNGYLYNLADLFNQVNVLDPKGEKEGIGALDTKWNITDTARLEAVILPRATVSETDHGLRGQFTAGSFEFTANALRKTLTAIPPATGQTLRFAYVLECKGELGETAPGLWFQGGYFRDEPSAGEINKYHSYVFGTDYTVPVGNGLYLLGEYQQNSPTDGHDKLYFNTRYSVNGNLTWSLAGLRDIEEQAGMYSLNLKYFINDSIEFSGSYNYYPQGSQKVLEIPVNNTREIILGVKTSF